MKDRVNELMQEIHEELNARGEYNTYLITENLANHQVFMDCYTAKENLSEEESKSFSKMFSFIQPYIKKRTKMFADEKKQVNHLHIDTLIGELTVNTPKNDKGSKLSKERLLEAVKSILLDSLKDVKYIEQEHSESKKEDQRIQQIGHSLACYLKGLGQPPYEVAENLYLFGFTEDEINSIL